MKENEIRHEEKHEERVGKPRCVSVCERRKQEEKKHEVSTVLAMIPVPTSKIAFR